MSAAKLEMGAAAGLAGFGIYQLFSVYSQTAPSLEDLRNAPTNDLQSQQRLLDCDLFVGAMAVLVGGAAAFLSRRPEPLILALAGFGLISFFFHWVQSSPSVTEVYGGKRNE